MDYATQTLQYRRTVHPIDHRGVANVIRFLPKEIDVCRYSQIDITTIQLTSQRAKVPKYDVAQLF